VLALNGLGKVLKANMATVLTLPGFDEKWEEICSIAARVLCCGRKSVAVAAAQLLTGFLQVGHGTDVAFGSNCNLFTVDEFGRQLHRLSAMLLHNSVSFCVAAAQLADWLPAGGT
jgi:hypothetical protein